MADDNKPQHLDPSDHSGDETTTHHRTTTDETRALPEISDEGTESANAPLDDVASDAQASQDAAPDEGADEPVEDAQPAETVTEEVDPETRMLQQIAALKSGDQIADDAASEESGDERSAADADSPDIVSADASEDDAQAEAVPHTTVFYDSPSSIEATQQPDQTETMPPIAVAAAGGSAAGPNEPADTARKKKRRWPWVLVVLIVLLGGGYVAAAFATQDALPATLTVEGVDVSGLSAEDAAPRLEEAFAERAQREISVVVQDHEATLIPAESGYSYDVEATLDDLTALTFNPVELWARLFGEAHVPASKSVDEETSSETIAGLAEQLTFDPTEGSVVYEGAELDYTEPVDGFTVDDEALAELVAAEWLGEETELTAPGEVEDPAISGEQWEQFVADTAQPLVEDNYTVTAADATTELTPAQLGAAAEVRVEGAAEETAATDGQETSQEAETSEATESEDTQGVRPVLILDGEALTDSLAENNADFESTNQDATVRLAGSAGSGRPEVVPGSTGRGVDDEQVVDEILADLAGEQTRSITVDLHEVKPEVTTEDAEAWDVNHIEAEYATPYPPNDGPRTANLRIGADRVNGTVVMPGEEFNLDAILGPITAANGYHSSGVVESGVTTNAIGGGLSQIATMAYNAGFLGGMEIVEHKPHSRWFDRYPQGRESTYWEGQINVRWKNDTDAPVIVEMWLANNQVHTRLWGSDYYDVSTTTSEPYNHTASPTIRNSDSQCVAERGGREGFTVDVHRTKTPPDGSPIKESWRWAYSGWPTVICE
ncbi:VanW family protein [Enteractinococcus coprophilus]|uniref:Vancomycin resistance protein YoaR n=1 Tax=Enteractinococcus coprophilus TaxID=1027633 RepID=A0A543APG3_9MICC|nr:VanW family protein [Enteractinococcus coprophilus]TQL74458.1 vancomycin resistance protein YoaR [Enteractinococcus coprophilus]